MNRYLPLLIAGASFFVDSSYAQNVGVDVASPVEKLDVLGAIRIGNTSNTNAGTIRWNSPDFEGYNGSTWVNLGGGGTVTGSGTATRVAFWNGTSSLSSNANLFWDNTNSRLGIGTSSPAYKLDISGSDYLSLKLIAPTSPLLKFSGSYNSGNGAEMWQDNLGNVQINLSSLINALYLKSTGDVGIGNTFPSTPAARLDVNNGSSTVPIFLARDNGTEVMRIADGGNVGIGTTTPQVLLQVNGNGSSVISRAMLSSTSGSNFGALTPLGQLEFGGQDDNSGFDDNVAVIESYTTETWTGSGHGADLRFWTTPNGSATPVKRVVIDQSGNVGISSASPGALLDIAGTSKTTNFQMTSGASNGFVLKSDASGNASWVNANTLTVTETDPQVSSTTTNYVPKWNGTALVDGAIFDNGNIAIGTNSPQALLQVNGNGSSIISRAMLSSISGSNFGSNTPLGQIEFAGQDDNSGFDDNVAIIESYTTETWTGSGHGADLRFWTTPNGSSGPVKRVVIDQSGNVGIGSASPGALLDVNGQVKITGGTPGAGKVLTSDAAGLATWNTPNAGTVTTVSVASANGFAGTVATPTTTPAITISTSVNGILKGNGTAVSAAVAADFPSLSGLYVDLASAQTAAGVKTWSNNAIFNGNVGIGQSPGSASLDIAGTNAGTTSLQLRSGNSGSGTASNQVTFGFNGTENYRHVIKTRHNSGGNADNAIDFYLWKFGTDASGTVGTQHVMSIDGGNGGSVGIGTTSPGAQLHTTGSVRLAGLTSASQTSAVMADGSGNLSTRALNAVAFTGDLASGDADYIQNQNVGTNFSTGQAASFDITGNAEISGTLNTNGNVGIGTTSAAELLDIYGNAGINNGGMAVFHTSTSNNTRGYIQASESTGSGAGLIIATSGGETIAFKDGGIAGDLNMVITGANGNVGLGSASPSAKLDVAGTLKYADGSQGSGKVLTSDASGNATWNTLLPSGMIIPYAGATAPAGYLECNGVAVSRTTYASLFTAIGTMYGAGDGSTTFNLPDYRGNFLRGWSHSSGSDPDAASRTNRGDGTTGDNVGTKQVDDFKSHTHTFPRTNGSSGSTTAVLWDNIYSNVSSQSWNNTGGNETRPKNINVMYCIKY